MTCSKLRVILVLVMLTKAKIMSFMIMMTTLVTLKMIIIQSTKKVRNTKVEVNVTKLFEENQDKVEIETLGEVLPTPGTSKDMTSKETVAVKNNKETRDDGNDKKEDADQKVSKKRKASKQETSTKRNKKAKTMKNKKSKRTHDSDSSYNKYVEMYDKLDRRSKKFVKDQLKIEELKLERKKAKKPGKEIRKMKGEFEKEIKELKQKHMDELKFIIESNRDYIDEKLNEHQLVIDEILKNHAISRCKIKEEPASPDRNVKTYESVEQWSPNKQPSSPLYDSLNIDELRSLIKEEPASPGRKVETYETVEQCSSNEQPSSPLYDSLTTDELRRLIQDLENRENLLRIQMHNQTSNPNETLNHFQNKK